MKEIPLPKSWIFSDIKGIREKDYSATYYHFEYDKLPVIPNHIELDDKFGWLEPFPQYFTEEQWGKIYNFGGKLEVLQEEAKQKGLSIPQSFINFMSKSNLIKKIRSNTSCVFDLSDYIEEIPNTNGIYFLKFLSDSQFCCHWYLCLDKEGHYFIGNSHKHYRSKSEYNEDYGDEYKDYIGKFCSYTFNEFIYRFWIENEIWYKIVWEKIGIENLNEMEKQYVQHYLNN